MNTCARLIGRPAATARAQNPCTSAASGSPRSPASASHAFNAPMSSALVIRTLSRLRVLPATRACRRLLHVEAIAPVEAARTLEDVAVAAAHDLVRNGAVAPAQLRRHEAFARAWTRNDARLRRDAYVARRGDVDELLV